MIVTLDMFSYCDGPLQVRLCFRESPLDVMHLSQCFQAFCHIRVIEPKNFFSDFKGPLEAGFCFWKIAPGVIAKLSGG